MTPPIDPDLSPQSKQSVAPSERTLLLAQQPVGESPPRGDLLGLVSPGAESLSPALLPRSFGEAREIKFRVPSARLAELTSLLERRLKPDLHGDTSSNGDYGIASLYCDTPDLEVFRQLGWHRFRKFRVRRYGASDLVFLERKTRLGDLVRKERVAIPLGELARVGELGRPPFLRCTPDRPGTSTARSCADERSESPWAGEAYRRQVTRRGVQPTCFIQYVRRAFVGVADQVSSPARGGGTSEQMSTNQLRVTIDRSIRGTLANGWSFAPSGALEPVMPAADATKAEWMAVEIKFSGSTPAGVIPAAVKELVALLGLTDRGCSKYRQCMRMLTTHDVRCTGDAFDATFDA
jgi:hypothetical protein